MPRLEVRLDPLDARRQRLGVDRRRSPARAPSRSTGAGSSSPRRWRSSSSTGCSPSRWAAPPIDVALDHRHLGAEPGGVRGRGVPGRPATDDHEPGAIDGQAMAQPAGRPIAGIRPWAARSDDGSQAARSEPVPSRPCPTPTMPTRPRRWQRAGRRAGPPPGVRSTSCAPPAPSRTRTASTAPTASPTCAPRGADLEPGTETDDEVAVAGRVMLKRDTGKLVFATIAERGAERPAVRLQGGRSATTASPTSRRSTAATGSAPTAR